MAVEFPIPFEKMSGAGNDFVLIDNRKGAVPLAEQADFARKVCRRMFSVGADGLILIEDCGEADFRWQFYNADGSVAEMCGNGSRCAARFAFRAGITGRDMTFSTLAGIISARVGEQEEIVSVKMTAPCDFRLGLSVTLDEKEYPVSFVNSGVPHAVIFVEGDVPVTLWGRSVRYDKQFEPAGTNVDFVWLKDDGLKVRTYERGIEGETMACGTGAVAAALYAAMQKGYESPVAVETFGGDTNTVYFDLQDGPVAKDVFLQGPTRLVCTGQITSEALI